MITSSWSPADNVSLNEIAESQFSPHQKLSAEVNKAPSSQIAYPLPKSAPIKKLYPTVSSSFHLMSYLKLMSLVDPPHIPLLETGRPKF